MIKRGIWRNAAKILKSIAILSCILNSILSFCQENHVGICFDYMPSEIMTLSLIKINGGQSHVS